MARIVRFHRCDVCGRDFVWGRESRVFGSLMHEDAGFRQFLVCSKRCMGKTPTDDELSGIVGKVTLRGVNGASLSGDRWDEWDARRTTNA